MNGERREGMRAKSFARILITIEDSAGYVADVSPNGFRGLFPNFFDIEKNMLLEINVSFEELGVGPFSVFAKARWTKFSDGAFEVGFELMPACGRAELLLFERIRYYYSQPFREKT